MKIEFLAEKTDFFKTPGDKVYLNFWRKKRRLHLYPGLNTRVDFFEKKKSTPSKNRAIMWKSSFWREKVDFFKTPGDEVYSTFWRKKRLLHLYPGLNTIVDFFAKNKSTPLKNRAMKWKSSFWREKVDFIKTPGDKVYFSIWQKNRRLQLCPSLNTRVEFLAKKSRPHRKTGLWSENRVFGGKKSTSSKHLGIKFICHFGGKNDVINYTRV